MRRNNSPTDVLLNWEIVLKWGEHMQHNNLRQFHHDYSYSLALFVIINAFALVPAPHHRCLPATHTRPLQFGENVERTAARTMFQHSVNCSTNHQNDIEKRLACHGKSQEMPTSTFKGRLQCANWFTLESESKKAKRHNPSRTLQRKH